LDKNFLEGGRGERARLFPVLSEKSKEGRAASIFLTCLQIVPDFANAIFKPVGRSIGIRAKVTCRTEIVFRSNPKLRPDGLITVDSGRTKWNALVEFKVGGTLDSEQVENYLKLARENKIDAVITISNDLAPDPQSSPISVDLRLKRSVELYHFSWMHIFTQAELLLQEGSVSDVAQRFILAEFARFLFHKSTGIKGYEAMPEAWQGLIQKVRSQTRISKSDIGLIDVVDGWIQEEREISLIFSRQTGANCRIKRKRGKDSISDIRNEHINSVINSGNLCATIQVPGAASPIDVYLNLMSRSIFVQMSLKAPKDRKRNTASLNWLLKQLRGVREIDPSIRANWPSKAAPSEGIMSKVMENPEILLNDKKGLLPHSFDIILRRELNASFNSRKKIISILESTVSEFYKEVGSSLIEWTPKAPQTREKTSTEKIVADANFDTDNDHLSNPVLE